MRKMLKSNLPLITLILISVFISYQNYTPGTILSGWDTLHPEFNFGLAIKREIFGVFRSYQGLGAVAAHSDMADLPRIALLAALNIFLPMDFLRYSYIFLTLILGPIGMYLFLSRHVLKNKTSSFLGGLFYLLNLGTLQQFAVPFEMFVTQYATLPWLFLFATDFLLTTNNPKRSLLFFAFFAIMAAPQAYAATLWYIYFIAFAMYVSVLAIIGNKRVARAFTLILLTLLLNSFWILPNIYYIFVHGSEVPQANINKLFSEQAFLYNKEFGNIKDITMLKSFLFDWNVYAGNNHFAQLLNPWIQHLKHPFVELLGYLFALVAIWGIIYSIFKGNKILIALLPILFLCLFFLFNDNPPSSTLYSFLQENFSFFKEAYRFPQDKVRGVYTFVFAVYFGAGQFAIMKFVKVLLSRHSGERTERSEAARLLDRGGSDDSRISFSQSSKERFWTSQNDGKRATLQHIQILIFSILILYFMLPAFNGQFINPYMRIKIPDYYFEMFKWFDKRNEDARVANLPIHSFWGWDYYDWYGNAVPSFQGAGFIWFGIKQPILARDFDRWNPYNEQYYREMSYAIYAQNPEALRLTIEKYNIKYILLDKNIIAPPIRSKVLLYEETEELLDKQSYIQKVKEFGNSLIVYEVRSKTPYSHYIIQNPFIINEEPKVIYEDLVYKDYGDYIIKQDGVFYPFRNITDNQNKILPNILKLTQEGVVIRLPKNAQNLTLPSYLDTQESLPSDLLVEKNQNRINITLYPRLPALDTKARPTPITIKAPIPNAENIILSINEKDNFILDNSLSNTPLSLGTVFLPTKSNTTVSIYSVIPDQEIIPDLSTTNHYIEPCEPSTMSVLGKDMRSQKVFGIELLGTNSFYIFGKNVPLCMTIPLSSVLPKNLNNSQALLNVKFNYSSNLPLKFCIAKIANAACQNYRSNSLLNYAAFETEDLQALGLQFQLDTTKSHVRRGKNQTIEKALYDNLSLSLTYPFFSASFSSDALQKSVVPIDQALLRHSGTEAGEARRVRLLDKRGNQTKPEHPESLNGRSDSGQARMTSFEIAPTLILPFSGNEQLSTKITEFPITTGLCPNQPRNNPPVIKKEINDQFIRYTSKEGTACDHFSYQNLSQNEAYLIVITSRNIKGLPLTICVANQLSKHCDIYASLSPSRNFTTNIFFLPSFIKNESGFDVNIRNLGIKKTPAVNDLKSIEIIPFPYKWLSQIRHSGTESGEARRVRLLDKRGNQAKPETPESVLILPQSFEKGWKAYQVQSSIPDSIGDKVQSWINNTFPFFLGEELKDHVLVNNWTNGWVLNNEAMKQYNNSTIAFVFLPQYLEYLGFALLTGTLIYLVKTHKTKNT